MKVLHVLSSLQLGGAERLTLDLTRFQREQGLDASILNLGSEHDELVVTATELGVPLTISSAEEPRLKRYRNIITLIKTADVVHIHSPFALRFLTPLTTLIRATRYIYTRHGLASLDDWHWRLLHRYVRDRIDAITFVTQAGLDVFRKYYSWHSNKLHVVENGVYIPKQMDARVPATIRFGSVGRMVELKGQTYLLESISKLTSEHEALEAFELHFFGSGPLEAELRSLSTRIERPCEVHFHGLVLDRERIYNGIDVLIVSSETEGLSMVIMEAMARGIPVIATDVGGNTTLVRDGENGFIVPFGDTEAMGSTIMKVIKNKSRIPELGRNARAHIQEGYSLTHTHRQYMELYAAAHASTPT